VTVVRTILVAFLKLIISHLKPTNSWRSDITHPSWVNLFDTLSVVEDFVCFRSYKTELKTGFHLFHKGCRDTTLVSTVVDLLNGLCPSQLDQMNETNDAADRMKLRRQFKRQAQEDLLFFTALRDYFQELATVNESNPQPTSVHRMDLSTLMSSRPRFTRFHSTSSIAKGFFDNNYEEILQCQKAQLLAPVCQFASTQDKDRKDQERAEDEITKEEALKMKEACKGEPLGEGSFGKVYRVELYGLSWAVKMVHVSAQLEKIVQSEIDVYRRLRSRRCVIFRGAYTKPPDFLILTEYMSGGNLAERIHKIKMLTDADRFRYAVQIAEALSELHYMNPPIVHRDLKPTNVLLDEHGDIKLCDFGFAHTIQNSTTSSTATQKSFAGTDLYKAPEVWHPQMKVDVPSDIYSYGIVLHEIFVGRPPWSTMSREALWTLHVRDRIAPPVDDNLRSLHPQVATLIEKCTRVDPKKRPTASQLIVSIRSLIDTMTKQVSSTSVKHERRESMDTLLAHKAASLSIPVMPECDDTGNA
jgi:hypothetical protein